MQTANDALPELLDDEPPTLRIVGQSLAELAAEWAEALERRHATEAVAGFWDAAVELHEGDRP